MTPESRSERVREEFTKVRNDYAGLLTSALSKEELTRRMRLLAVRGHLRRAENTHRELRWSLAEIEQAGGTASEAARPLEEKAAALESGVKRLRESVGIGEDWPAGWNGLANDDVIRNWFESFWNHETRHLAATFRRLTVRDEFDRLAVEFGPLPLFRKSVPYAEIEGVERGRTTLLDNWGIHYLPGRGRTWSLWGFDCVVLYLSGGKTLKVGTDDPKGLEVFLTDRLSSEKRVDR